MRALGIDLGTKRIGVAVSAGSFASPLEVIQRSGDPAADHRRIAQLATEEEVDCVVVGLPIDLRGERAIAAQNALIEVEALATVVSVPIHTYDERMTTAVAAKQLRGTKNVRSKIDKVAAAVMLQGWLDSRS